MSDVATEKSMAPKRQRMMDMVLFIGGLKEESTIPPSKVIEEIENLKRDVTPLTESILEFPDAYLAEFIGVFILVCKWQAYIRSSSNTRHK